MHRKQVSARRRLKRGDGSRIFTAAADGIKQGDLVLAVSRVSYWEQKRRGNDGDQLNGIIDQVKTLGATLAGTVAKTASGYDPIWLVNVFDQAKELNAKVLFESVDRAIRHPGYCKEDQRPQARDIELDTVKEMAGDLILATVLDPRATWDQVRSYQTKRGLEAKRRRGGKRGGRPNVKKPGYKKKRREERKAEAIRLRYEEGWSLGAIAKELGVARSTIADWVRAV